MPRLSATSVRVNTSLPLFQGIANLWLPLRPVAGGRRYWDFWSGNHATLTNAPTWKNTPFGPGVETGVAATNAYVDVNNIQLSRNFSVFFSFRQRYDTSSSGAITETGILYGAGTSGVSFRLTGTTLELLKSHIASILSVGVTTANGDWHTAGFTISVDSTATFTLYFDGLAVATTTSATTFTGTGTTTFGFDDNATAAEYGRHTILGGALWNGQVVSADGAKRWHDAARREFRPLLQQRPAWIGTPVLARSVYRPTVQGPPIPGAPWRLRPYEIVPTLYGAPAPAVTPSAPRYARMPSAIQGPPIPGAPWFHLHMPREAAGLYGRGAPPAGTPGGVATGASLLRVPRVPREGDPQRLARFTEIVSAMLNSLIDQGFIVRDGVSDWRIDGATATGGGLTGSFP